MGQPTRLGDIGDPFSLCLGKLSVEFALMPMTLEVHTMSGIHLYWHNNPQQNKQAPDGHLQFEYHLQKAL